MLILWHCKINFFINQILQNPNWSKPLQLIPDDFLPTSEQYLPTSLTAAFSTSKPPIMQLDLLFGTTDLENINQNGWYSNCSEILSRFVSYGIDNTSFCCR
jgi:hypothetical protein